ncbi:MAG TPA: nitroreductase family deazaflavin-dependent oxidoreductase [Candidatus Binatia bacterium]|jgi:deazaflavin-dependent oxidoreductase (nitroreductase family)|nr:nitroreductase family deazaflavin-dependent oxidoreductase [Candidatus Binatia bacterium]
MQQPSTQFMQPTVLDRIINRAFGFMVKLGFGLSHNFLLEVRGRKSGRIYSTPVNVLEYKGKKYLVAPRGDTQWVRNVAVTQKATLVKGAKRENVRLRPLADEAKAEILKAYLDRYKLTVQRYFPIPAGSPLKEFEPLVGRYPVLEITRDT